jgi:asparagine synthase (glutamine-hydrolysing)
MSDSALLFEGLLAWGPAAVDRLVGDFAFAFWDEAERTLLLARDILGLRPLYFHRGEGFVAFSSMPSGLHALPDIPYEFDSEYLAETLALLPQTGSKSHFRNIERVEPAHIVHISRHHVRSHRYWNPEPPSGRRLPPGKYEEQLREAIDKAIAAQLRGAGDLVATHLSGGLDSGIVTASAARQFSPGKILAFTAVPRAGFDGPIPRRVLASERDRAAATAGLHDNIEHILVESSAESPLAEIDREFFYQQQPPPALCNNVWAKSIHRQAQQRGVRVLLTGTMGNMSVTYSGQEWLSELIGRGRFLKAGLLALAIGRSGDMSWLSLGAQLIGPYLPLPLWRLVSRRATDLSQYSAVHPMLLSDLSRKARERALDFAYRPRKNAFETRIWALSRVDTGNYYKGVLGQWGLSSRDPTADKRVIELSLSVPPEEFVRGGVRRSLARRAFAERLPPDVAKATVRGYQSADWYEALGSDLQSLHDEIAKIERCGPAASVIDMAWLKQTSEAWPTGGWADDSVIMRYRYGLLRAVSAGHFMRKVAGTN